VHQNAFAAGILPRTPVTALPRLARWNLWRGGEKKKRKGKIGEERKRMEEGGKRRGEHSRQDEKEG